MQLVSEPGLQETGRGLKQVRGRSERKTLDMPGKWKNPGCSGHSKSAVRLARISHQGSNGGRGSYRQIQRGTVVKGLVSCE